MPLTGTTIFSHIIPVIFGFFGVLLVVTGILDENKPKLGLGIVLFAVGCIFPYVVLSALI